MAKEKNNKKNVKTKSKKTKSNLFGSLMKELKLVKWPAVKEIVKYSIATIVFCLIFIGFFQLLNIIMAFVKGMFN